MDYENDSPPPDIDGWPATIREDGSYYYDLGVIGGHEANGGGYDVDAYRGTAFGDVYSSVMKSLSLPPTGLFNDFKNNAELRGYERLQQGHVVAAFIDWAAGNVVYNMFNPKSVPELAFTLMPLGITRAVAPLCQYSWYTSPVVN